MVAKDITYVYIQYNKASCGHIQFQHYEERPLRENSEHLNGITLALLRQ